MRYWRALFVIMLVFISSCETPIDSSSVNDTDDSKNNASNSTPHIVEVSKNDSAALSPTVPVPDTSPSAPSPTAPPTPVVSVPSPTPVPSSVPSPTPAPTPSPPIKSASSQQDSDEDTSDTNPVGPSPQAAQASLTDPLNDEAKILIAKTDQKVKSYDFLYAPPPDNLARDKYYVKGTKMKIELFDRGWFNPDTHMTAIYVDAATKTATGFCEDNRLTHCPDPDRRFPVSYDTYAIKTPYQWLKDIQYGVLGQGEKLNERMTQRISYKKGNNVIEQWLDTYSGLPMRVRITNSSGEFVYDFRHVNINSVTDAVFIHSATG